MTLYTLYIQNSSGWWHPAYSEMQLEEAEDALKTWPTGYGEISRKLVEEAPSIECSENWLRHCGG